MASTCSSVSANHRYETAFPRDDILQPCLSDNLRNAADTRTSSKSSSSRHVCPIQHQPVVATHPPKFVPSPNGVNKSKLSNSSPHSSQSDRSNKVDSPLNGFEPILAPREKSKCVPKKVMKPIVGNSNSNSVKSMTDVEKVSPHTLPNGTAPAAVHGLEEQCNSCSCFYHQCRS